MPAADARGELRRRTIRRSARIRFFAIAALVANVLFLMIVLLSGLSAIVNTVCRQA